jgi:hypothetical protein
MGGQCYHARSQNDHLAHDWLIGVLSIHHGRDGGEQCKRHFRSTLLSSKDTVGEVSWIVTKTKCHNNVQKNFYGRLATHTITRWLVLGKCSTS